MKNRTRIISLVLTTLMITSLLLEACRGDQPTATSTPAPTETSIASATTPLPTATTHSSKVDTQTATPPRATAQTLISPKPTETSIALPTPAALASIDLAFARFEEPTVEAKPAVQHEAIASDLSNVLVPFVLSDTQRDRLARDGFVVSHGIEKEFFTVYEKARYANVPIFVTSDSLLHVYHLLFDKVLRTAEVRHFIPLLQDLNRALLGRTEDQHAALQGTAWEDAARRSVAFVGVASKLL